MSTLGLEGSSQDVVAAVAQVLVLQLVAQDLLGEARLVALHGRRRGRLLRGHGVCSHVTPGRQEVAERQRNDKKKDDEEEGKEVKDEEKKKKKKTPWVQ